MSNTEKAKELEDLLKMHPRWTNLRHDDAIELLNAAYQLGQSQQPDIKQTDIDKFSVDVQSEIMRISLRVRQIGNKSNIEPLLQYANDLSKLASKIKTDNVVHPKIVRSEADIKQWVSEFIEYLNDKIEPAVDKQMFGSEHTQGRNQAFRIAIAGLRHYLDNSTTAPKTDWIPIKRLPPPRGKQVRIYTTCLIKQKIAARYENYYEISESGVHIQIEFVTHWKELDEPELTDI